MNALFEPITLPVTLPFLGGVLCLLLPRRLDRERGLLALAVSIVTLMFACKVFAASNAALGSGILLRSDPLSGFILLAAAAFGVLICLYSLVYMRDADRLREYYAYLLWTVGFSCGVLLAANLILLLVFWGLLGLTLYILIGIAGPDASAAAKKSFIVIGGSDCLLLLGVVICRALTGSFQMGAERLSTTGGYAIVAFLCFAAAAFAKAGCMPFHSWVPDCGEKAPLSVTAFLPASLDKLLGIYLLARTVLTIFSVSASLNILLMLCGAGTVICAVMMALVQHDLKRLLSYHAVSQVGYMVLGIGTGTVVGIAGGLFHMLNHAIYKSCLFLCAGDVEKQAGTTDLDKLGGLARVMPLTFGSCLVAAMAISGVPPLNGFYSKWMVYQGVVLSGQSGDSLWLVWLAAAMVGSALTLASFVKVLHAVFLRKPSRDIASRAPGGTRAAMLVPIVSLAALCLVFGVFAWRLPIRTMIKPAMGTDDLGLLGTWRAGMSTAMLFIGYVLGLAVYALTTARKPRECPTYIGGELLEETFISGEGRRAGRDLEVSGVDFYRTVEDMQPFRGIYAAARNKLFDIYEVGTKAVFYFVELLRGAHSGRLPTYLTWMLGGFLALIWILVTGGRMR